MQITGQLTSAQIASLHASQIAGALTSNQISSLSASQIVGALTSAQIASVDATKLIGQVTSAQVASLAATQITGQLTSAQIASLQANQITGQLSSAQISSLSASQIAGALTSAQIASMDVTKLVGQITSTQITDGSVTTAKIGAGQVTAAKILAGTITGNEVAANTITAANILTRTITAAQIAAGTVTANEIAARTIAANNIIAGAITGNEIAANTITAANIYARTITAAQILAGTITANEIAARTIVAGNLVAGTITANEIAANTITAAKIAANTITAGQIAANTITSAQIAANTITAGQIAANTITSAQIAANTITAGQIAAGAIGTSQLAAGAITATQIASRTITATQIQAGAITANEIAANTITAAQIWSGYVYTGTLNANQITVGKLSASQIDTQSIVVDDTMATALNSAASTSTWAGVSGTGKPADNATATYRQGTRPVAQIAGDQWVDTGTTNLAQYSETLLNAVYVLENATKSATTPPDGISSAIKLVESTAATTHDLYQAYTGASGATYSSSYLAKAGERTALRLTLASSGFTNGGEAYFDLNTGTVISSANRGTGTNTTAAIYPYGNGWYWCTVTTKPNFAGSIYAGAICSIGTNSTYTGNGTSGVYLAAHQFEAQAGMGSYVATTGTSAANNLGNNTAYVWDGSQWALASTIWSAIPGTGKPADNASADIVLVAGGPAVVSSNTITKPSATVPTITNGTFASNLNGWTTSGSVAWSSGIAQLTPNGSNGAASLSQPIATVPGRTYSVTFDILTGPLIVVVGTANGGNDLYNSTSALTQPGTGRNFTFTATTTTSYLMFTRTAAGTYGVDNVSITEAWDSGAYSKDSFTGGAYASASPQDATHSLMFGLNSAGDLTDNSYITLDYAIYLRSDGTILVYENGAQVGGTYGSYVGGDVFAVAYDGSGVDYLKNGTIFYTSTSTASKTAGQVLFFDSSFATSGGKLNNVRFGPMSSNNWVNIGGTGKPADNATVGADATNLNVTIGGDNLTNNSSFETVASGTIADGWSIYNGGGASETTTAYKATGRTGGNAQGISWTTNHTASKGIHGQINTAGWMPGKTYTVSFWAMSTSVPTPATLLLAWNTSPTTTVYVSNPSLSGSWQRYIFRITWGASVEAGGHGYVTVAYGSGAGNVIFDDFMVCEGDVAPAYYPSTNEAATNASTALSTLNDPTTGLAQRMRANTANVLSGGAGFTAGSLTYDATTGNRTGGYGLMMNKNGIVAYNSSGVNTITINGSTGAVSMRSATILADDGTVLLASGSSLAQQTSTNPNLCPAPIGMTMYSPAAGYRNGDIRFGDGQYVSIPATSDSSYCGVESPALGIPANMGSQYTVSFDAYCTSAGRVLNVDVVNDSDYDSAGISVALTTTMTRYSFTETALANANAPLCRLRMFTQAAGGGTIIISNIKVELGNKVTPWCDSIVTPANASTYIKSAAIGLAQINTASIGSLAALSGVVGNVGLDNGRINSGQTGYDSGNGFWLEGAGSGHGARMSLGNSSGAKFLCDPSNGVLGLYNAVVINTSFSVSTANLSPRSLANNQTYNGTITPTITGGSGNYAYQWSLSNDDGSNNIKMTSGPGDSTLKVSAIGNNVFYSGRGALTLRDLNTGAIASCTVTITIQFGTGQPT
jgi:hypothetical protein